MMKIFYKTSATAIGGRSGHARLDDGSFDVEMSTPGSGKSGVNPEQLFALGYAACFDNALIHVAQRLKMALPGSQTRAEVGMGQNASGGFSLDVDLHVSLFGVDQESGEKLLAAAHAACPYSNALKGNVEVRLHLTVVPKQARVLMVLTSHDQLGNTGHKTGFWLEEFAAPYYTFRDAGARITLASPKGGQPPLDPKSDDPAFQTEETRRFRQDPAAQAALAATSPLAGLHAEDFDAVFYVGGHGPLWDLSEDAHSIALIEAFDRQRKPVAAVCHAPAVLRHARQADGRPLVAGKRVTGFSNSEEDAVQLSAVVPFLIEDEFKRLGADYRKGDDWLAHVEVDGLLITGQNPASSAPVAEALLQLLSR
uniref:Ohr family peroxiredoxin n=1 Tax=Paludibacterium sp. THUN1379 TaxID=3112107 RepID=UPI00403F7147